MKNSLSLANYSLNVFLEVFVFQRVFFFAFFWSIWRRSALEPDFSLESSTSLFQEASSSAPQRIVQTVWVCLHSPPLQLGVYSGIFIMLPWHGPIALLQFYYSEIRRVSLVLFHSQLLASVSTCDTTQDIFSRTLSFLPQTALSRL